jgi:tetratricopeptide (TPR) repeat protein
MNSHALSLGAAALVLTALGYCSWRWYDGQQHLLLARSLVSQRNPAAAVVEYSKAIELLRDNHLYAERGSCLAMAGQDQGAITDLSVALGLDPTNTDTLLTRGAAYLSAGQLQAALADIDTYISLKPTSRAAFRLRAITFTRLHKYDLAVLDCSAVLKHRPEDRQALEVRSYAYWQAHQYKEAVADLSRLIAIVPSSGTFLLRGSCYQRLGQRDKAAADFARAAVLDPQSEAAAFNLKAVHP